jgi:hypothetical protein
MLSALSITKNIVTFKIQNQTSYIKNFQGTNKTSFKGQGTLTSYIRSEIPSNFNGSFVKVFTNE